MPSDFMKDTCYNLLSPCSMICDIGVKADKLADMASVSSPSTALSAASPHGS